MNIWLYGYMILVLDDTVWWFIAPITIGSYGNIIGISNDYRYRSWIGKEMDIGISMGIWWKYHGIEKGIYRKGTAVSGFDWVYILYTMTKWFMILIDACNILQL